jgi:hypothetical protein
VLAQGDFGDAAQLLHVDVEGFDGGVGGVADGGVLI